MQVRIEVALPIVPKSPGVILQIWASDARTLEGRLRVPAIEPGGVVHKRQHVFGQTQVFHDGVAHATHRRQGHQALGDAAGNETQQGRVDEQVHLGRMRRLAEDIQHVAHAITFRVHQMKTLFGDALLVADGIQRVHHKVHRHDVDAAALQANGRHPGWQQLAHALDQLEKVIRAVDLVHLARGAISHHHRGAIDRPGHLALLADDLFALVLGHEVRMIVVFRLLKHVLAEDAFIQTRRRDGTHVVKVARVNGLGQFYRVARAFNVDRYLAGLIRTQVVDRCQMVEVINLALEKLDRFSSHAQLLAGQVPKDRNGAGCRHAPVLTKSSNLAFALLANQEVDNRAFPVQKFFDKPLANEAGCTGNKILHENSR